ncbi:MAG: DUF6600 domain-containing protein [Bacteroidota bacterium]
MKRTFKLAALALIIVPGSSLSNNIAAQYDDYDRGRDVTYQDFYDELSPHGRWVEYPGQGSRTDGTSYVWVPDAGDDFRPYSSNGHWVWTEDYEWMWVSDYDWGWAPFHYGRWDYDSYIGWYWVPGYEWSPAWVAWRDGGDYYGWAPIRPGISISINFNIGGYNPPNDFWCFAPRRYITHRRVRDYCVDRRQNMTIINYTTIINYNNYRSGYGFRSGPRRYEAERYCGRINPVRFRESYSPGRTFYRNNEVNVYRPSIRQDNNRQFAPRSFERYDRSNGNFRNRSNDNGYRRNDDNDFRRDNAINNRPDRRDRVDNNRSFDRRDDNNGRSNDFRRDNNTRQPRQDNNPPQPDRRRFDRPDNNNDRQPGRNDDRRIYQPNERPNRDMNPGNRNIDNNRRFDRRPDERRVENNPARQPEQRTDDNWRRRQPQQIERRQEQHQPPQQMERRQEQRQPPQQIERRQEQPQQRSFERRSDDGNRQQSGGERGNGSSNGGGRKRFERN